MESNYCIDVLNKGAEITLKFFSWLQGGEEV